LPMLRFRPLAWWVIPWGMLAGIILTLLCLGAGTWEPLTDCGQRVSPPYSGYSPPGGCSTIAEGYPVRFLSSEPLLEQNPGTSSREAGISGVPVINKGGLAEDWLIWSIVGCLALYVVSARRLYVFSARKTEGELEQATDPAASA
jgi:amino acid transporter